MERDGVHTVGPRFRAMVMVSLSGVAAKEAEPYRNALTGSAPLKPPPRRAENEYVGKLAFGASVQEPGLPGSSQCLGRGCWRPPASKDRVERLVALAGPAGRSGCPAGGSRARR